MDVVLDDRAGIRSPDRCGVNLLPARHLPTPDSSSQSDIRDAGRVGGDVRRKVPLDLGGLTQRVVDSDGQVVRPGAFIGAFTDPGRHRQLDTERSETLQRSKAVIVDDHHLGFGHHLPFAEQRSERGRVGRSTCDSQGAVSVHDSTVYILNPLAATRPAMIPTIPVIPASLDSKSLLLLYCVIILHHYY